MAAKAVAIFNSLGDLAVVEPLRVLPQLGSGLADCVGKSRSVRRAHKDWLLRPLQVDDVAPLLGDWLRDYVRLQVAIFLQRQDHLVVRLRVVETAKEQGVTTE